MEYNAHALGYYHGYLMTDSKEALENSYKTGFRIFEVDIQRTSDGHFIAYHMWTKDDADRLQIPFDPSNPVPDLKTFRNYRYLTKAFPGGLTPLTLKEIFAFMKKHPDTTMMFDFKAAVTTPDNPELMQSLAAAFTDEDLIRQSVVETYSLNNARYLYEAGYPNIQPWIDLPEYSEKGFQSIEEILDFIKKYSVKNVSISYARIKNNPAELEALHQAGVRVFSHSWESIYYYAWKTAKDFKEPEKLGLDVATIDLPMHNGRLPEREEVVLNMTLPPDRNKEIAYLSAYERIRMKFTKYRYRLLSHLLFGKKAKKYREKYKKLSAIV